MAVDEAILESCGTGIVHPTLRLYAWSPPCLSLGHAQPLSDVDLFRLKELGWDLVRRPTGGRAVLHADELTYAVIAPPHESLLAGGVLPSYRRLAGALVSALDSLGLAADMQAAHPPGTGRNSNPVCFEVPSTYEITVTGKKLIGSAQARRKEGVLQHGSLPLTGDLTRILQVLVFKDEQSRLEAGERLLERAATVETLLGKAIAWQQAADAMLEGFRSVLEVDLQNGGLTARERERAGELAEIKYSRL